MVAVVGIVAIVAIVVAIAAIVAIVAIVAVVASNEWIEECYAKQVDTSSLSQHLRQPGLDKDPPCIGGLAGGDKSPFDD